jgi:hypothetical protein
MESSNCVRKLRRYTVTRTDITRRRRPLLVGGPRWADGRTSHAQTWPTGRAFRGPAQSTRARHAESPARHTTKRAVPARERPGAVPGPRLRARGLARHGTRSVQPGKHVGRPVRHASGTPRAGQRPARRAALCFARIYFRSSG